jgi:hypothetical protein
MIPSNIVNASGLRQIGPQPDGFPQVNVPHGGLF